MDKLHHRFFVTVLTALTFLFSGSVYATDFVITANSVEKLDGSLSSVSPAVNTPSNAADYLEDGSSLGYNGPIGPWGPLGTLGPVGNNTWNMSYWVNAVGNWPCWSEKLTDLGGPLSEAGPLGPNGPLSQEGYDTTLPSINDFSKQLQAGGVWTVLGPIGPLGALGPLGPLGPIGAHGYKADYEGRYENDDVEVRTVEVDYNGGTRTYELFENYKESYAKSKTDNDTSFMVQGYVSWPYSETDTFEFESGVNQYVTIVLVPHYTLDDFDLTITDENGQTVATSNSTTFIDFIQLNNVPAGTRLKAEVTMYSSYHYYNKDYRLFVVGSTEYIKTAQPIAGNHQIER